MEGLRRTFVCWAAAAAVAHIPSPCCNTLTGWWLWVLALGVGTEV
jgi:hypothetical protein